MVPFEREISFYRTIEQELLREHHGKVALIKGPYLIGIFQTAEEARAEGGRLFGPSTFLVQPIEEPDLFGTWRTAWFGLLNPFMG